MEDFCSENDIIYLLNRDGIKQQVEISPMTTFFILCSLLPISVLLSMMIISHFNHRNPKW